MLMEKHKSSKLQRYDHIMMSSSSVILYNISCIAIILTISTNICSIDIAVKTVLGNYILAQILTNLTIFHV